MSKIFKVIGIIAVTSLLFTAVAGCATPVLRSITASPVSVSLAAKGTQQLKITATIDTKTEDVTTTCTYKSSDAKVATISAGGLVTGVAAGSAKITVSYTKDKVTKTVEISVTVAPTLASIGASPVSVSLAVKGTQQLKITATLDTKTEDVTTACTYKSSDAKVATVDAKGLITAVAKGSAKVTVSYTKDKVTKTVEIPVTVK